MGTSSSSLVPSEYQQQDLPKARRVAGAGNAINPQSGAPTRHHKHLYLVLGKPKIRYTGHPGRGPLMFHTDHYLGDHKEDGVESLEGFPLIGTVAMRPEPPSLIPTLSTAHSSSPTASLKFSVDVGPECSRMNPLTVEAFVASSVKFDPNAAIAGRGAFVVFRPSGLMSSASPGGSSSHHHGGGVDGNHTTGSTQQHQRSISGRPVSPFNTTGLAASINQSSNGPELNGKIFSQVITDSSQRLNFTSCEIPLTTLKSVTETKKAEGKHLPVEGCIIFRLSWKAKKIFTKKQNSNNNNGSGNNNNNTNVPSSEAASNEDSNNNNTNNNNNQTEDPLASTSNSATAGGGGGDQQQQQEVATKQEQEGISQMLLFWEIPDVSKLHPAQRATSSENTVTVHSSSTRRKGGNSSQQQEVNKDDIVKLKPFTSRYLFTGDAVEGHQNAVFRVDDVYDLAGDDDVGPSPSRAGENPHAASPDGTNNNNDDDNNNNGDDASGTQNNNNGNDTSTAAAALVGAAAIDDDSGNECVVCLTNPKNALLLPCRHLCLCTECAPMLRQQQNKCPVCRRAIEKVLSVG